MSVGERSLGEIQPLGPAGVGILLRENFPEISIPSFTWLGVWRLSLSPVPANLQAPVRTF